jgi:hypothetical protein
VSPARDLRLLVRGVDPPGAGRPGLGGLLPQRGRSGRRGPRLGRLMQRYAGLTLLCDSFIPAKSRCKGTQQSEDVAYIPTTPLGVQGPATAGGGANREKGRK